MRPKYRVFKLLRLISPLLTAFILNISAPATAASFSVGDLVSSPTQVNGFEGMTDSIYYQSSYTEDGIRVEEFNIGADGIWTTYGWMRLGFQGMRAWYPNGGDQGYVQITQADGSDFGNVSLITSSGFEPPLPTNASIMLKYSLLSNGVEVLSGSALQQVWEVLPVSFLGGGYDTIQLRAIVFGDEAYNDLYSTYNSLVIDHIKVSAVPLPSAAWLLGSGLLGLAGLGRKKNVV